MSGQPFAARLPHGENLMIRRLTHRYLRRLIGWLQQRSDEECRAAELRFALNGPNRGRREWLSKCLANGPLAADYYGRSSAELDQISRDVDLLAGSGVFDMRLILDHKNIIAKARSLAEYTEHQKRFSQNQVDADGAAAGARAYEAAVDKSRKAQEYLTTANEQIKAAAELPDSDTDDRADARRYAKKSIEALREIVSSGESEKARIAAATALLDRGYGIPSSETESGSFHSRGGVTVLIFSKQGKRK